jgi:homocysteine S-methyltransferase
MTKQHQGDLIPDDLMLTDGGLETVLVFEDGMELPAFAAFPLLETDAGMDRMRRYFRDYMVLAAEAEAGYVLETPTWRANPDWGAQLNYSRDDLRRVAHDAVELAGGLREEWDGIGRVLISGCIGPRGDGYVPGETMSGPEAAEYHRQQVGDLADAGADLVTAFTLSCVGEGVGVAAAAAERGIPSVIGFTVETDGRLPSGASLGEAIEQVDAATGSAPAWFLVNCAHPDHVLPGLPDQDEPWLSRIGAYRANASRMSHAELDEMEVLDDGDPTDLAGGYLALRSRIPGIHVIGGCCGIGTLAAKNHTDPKKSLSASRWTLPSSGWRTHNEGTSCEASEEGFRSRRYRGARRRRSEYRAGCLRSRIR